MRSLQCRHRTRARRRVDQARELAFVVRSAEPAPVAKHVHVDAIAEQRLLANRSEARVRPARNGERRQGHDEPVVVRFGRFGTDAGARAALHLSREARPHALLQSERLPTERVRGGELAQRPRAWRFDENGPKRPAISRG